MISFSRRSASFGRHILHLNTLGPNLGHFVRVSTTAQNVAQKLLETLDNGLTFAKCIDGDDVRAAEMYPLLFKRQINVELVQNEQAVKKFKILTEQLTKMNRGAGMKHVLKLLIQWFEPVVDKIRQEIKDIEAGTPGEDRSAYGPSMLILPPDQMAVITLHATLNAVLNVGNGGARVVQLCKLIGDLIELEVMSLKVKKRKDELRPWQRQLLKNSADANGNVKKIMFKRLGKLLHEDEWPAPIKLKLGAVLVNAVLTAAKTETGAAAYSHKIESSGAVKRMKMYGMIYMDATLFRSMNDRDVKNLVPRYLPMVIPPKDWDNRKKNSSCYYRQAARLMRTHSGRQMEALAHADMPHVNRSLNYLGRTPWRINGAVLAVVEEAWRDGRVIGKLPPLNDVPEPRPEDCMRVPVVENDTSLSLSPPSPGGVDAVEEEATTQERIESSEKASRKSPSSGSAEGQASGSLSGLAKERGEGVGSGGEGTEMEFDEKQFNYMMKKVKKKNNELNSLRCDMRLKLWVADEFRNDVIYFPYSLDFRGRAYPVPPNLNHISDDFCRGVLYFDQTKPLGPKGFEWLKVHLANLFGNNKISKADRVSWAEANMEEVLDSATRPLEGRKWWSNAESPFQALATCGEIVAAMESGDEASFLSRLPVHQDGSCNGLQHYAALGKDVAGAQAVNLTPSELPQDVYSKVLEIVMDKIRSDVCIADDVEDEGLRDRGRAARLVCDVVNRKVIKQTVMTSVYGVTFVGAREQVSARLEERIPYNIDDREMDKAIYNASKYVAALTLESLREMFTSAKSIMDWLGKCATLVASQGQAMSWVTPLGLPVIQPYRKPKIHQVKTVLQTVVLAVCNDALPVSSQKQRTAFPPNFVHSLDATHMMMTALRMEEAGLTFAPVHDSYWTHAHDVDQMNQILRECFVELYSQPLLEALHESLEARFPDVEFPPVPERGSLDLNLVRDSQYFFH